jgi:AraC-like DNA-binding protein
VPSVVTEPQRRPGIPLSRHLLRVRDLIDRAYAGPLDIPALARSAHLSPAYFSRSFRAAFGETPHQYLLGRRMERAKALLRGGDMSVTEVCLAVGFTSLGSFSAQFRRLVGISPTAYRGRGEHPDLARVPACLVKRYTRPVGTRPGWAVSEKRSESAGP